MLGDAVFLLRHNANIDKRDLKTVVQEKMAQFIFKHYKWQVQVVLFTNTCLHITLPPTQALRAYGAEFDSTFERSTDFDHGQEECGNNYHHANDTGSSFQSGTLYSKSCIEDIDLEFEIEK